MTLLSDTGIVSPQKPPFLAFIYTRIAGVVRSSIGVSIRPSPTTQADIDGREKDWAEKSDSFNSRIARLP